MTRRLLATLVIAAMAFVVTVRAEVGKADKETKKDGTVVYEVDVTNGGKKYDSLFKHRESAGRPGLIPVLDVNHFSNEVIKNDYTASLP